MKIFFWGGGILIQNGHSKQAILLNSNNNNSQTNYLFMEIFHGDEANGRTLIPGKDFECNKLTTSSENGDHLLIKVTGTCIQC